MVLYQNVKAFFNDLTVLTAPNQSPFFSICAPRLKMNQIRILKIRRQGVMQQKKLDASVKFEYLIKRKHHVINKKQKLCKSKRDSMDFLKQQIQMIF